MREPEGFREYVTGRQASLGRAAYLLVGDRQLAEDPYPAWETRDALLSAVRGLPARQRAVVVLRYYLDRTKAETAAALGRTVGTVKSQNAEALTYLRQNLGLAEGAAAAAGFQEGIA